jgi:hypothetical protein
MQPFIHHSLTMLEDLGMRTRYPDIRWYTENEEGGNTCHLAISDIVGQRVTIEQNQQMKFLMMFALLDFYADSTYLDLEGASFAQKYKKIPAETDSQLIFREVYRVAKVIRNCLVHSPTSFSVSSQTVEIRYEFRNTVYGLTMTSEALAGFYTVMVMYLKGDLGTGDYFLGIVRYIYSDIMNGVSDYSDEFGDSLAVPSDGIKIKPYARNVHTDARYEMRDGAVRFTIQRLPDQQWEGTDFHIVFDGHEYLVPVEALGESLSIEDSELRTRWRKTGTFPPVRPPKI